MAQSITIRPPSSYFWKVVKFLPKNRENREFIKYWKIVKNRQSSWIFIDVKMKKIKIRHFVFIFIQHYLLIYIHWLLLLSPSPTSSMPPISSLVVQFNTFQSQVLQPLEPETLTIDVRQSKMNWIHYTRLSIVSSCAIMHDAPACRA